MDECMRQAIQEAVKENVEASRRTLLGEIGTLFEKISEQNNSSQLSKISSLVSVEQPLFKRRSNEEQYKSNSKVLLKLHEANGNLDHENLLEAKSNVTEAINMLTHRQKLIQLADRSELGWRVVQEYESNPLAEDSDDEKRMYKAEARANKKLKAERAKKSKTHRTWPYKRGNGSQAQTSTGIQTSTGSVQKPALCFQCGKPGHWRQECPGNGSSNKISICNAIFLNSSLPGHDSDSIDLESHCRRESIDTDGITNDKVYTGKSQPTVISPVGRLKSHVNKWRSVEGSEYIKNVVENGYKLPFKELPPSVYLRNNKSARANPSFVTTEIGNLLEKGVVSMVSEKPVVVNPLTVAYNKKGKPRLVLDCRHVNQFIHLFKIKFEDTRVAISLFGKDIYAFTYDLKSAYHHIDISESHRTYLGFCWSYCGKKTYFIFNSLPFGLSNAGHIFSKTVRVIVKYLRAFGHNVVMFLDDGIGGHTDFETALLSNEFVKKTFSEFGFLIAEEKCFWMPSKVVTWLGCVFDYEQNRLFVTEERIDIIKKSIASILFQVEHSTLGILNVKVLASLVGRIISLQLVLGKVTRLRTREMYNCIISRASWNSHVLVSEEAIGEIKFWKNNVRPLNMLGRALHQILTCDVNVFCDASATGYGGYMEFLDESLMKIDEGLTLDLSPEVDKGLMDKRDGSMSPEVDYIPPEVGKVSVIKRALSILPAEEGKNLSKTHSALDSKSGRAKCRKGKMLKTVQKESYSSSVVGSWLYEEQMKSSTWREIEAVNRVLKSHVGINLKPSIEKLMVSEGVNVQKHDGIVDRMADYLLQSKADSTCQKYTNCFKHFDEYCTSKGFSSNPASPVVVAMYLTSMLDQEKSYSVISAAVYSIQWVHSLHGFENPTSHSKVRNLLEAAKRLRSSPVQKKDVIDSTMLQALCRMFMPTNDICTLRDLSMILLGYSGFMRFNELSSLRCCDISFQSDHLMITICKSKTDVYREGKTVPIAKGFSNARPYSMLQNYMNFSKLSVKSEEFLFRPCYRSKGISNLIKKNKALSYTRVRECIVHKLKLVAPNLNLGTHSLRAGGSTTAANAEGVSDRCLKRHGRLKTDISKDGYIVDSLESRLSITKKLNL